MIRVSLVFFRALVMASSSISVSDAGVGGSDTVEDVEVVEEIEQESGASGDVGSGSASRDEQLDLGAGVWQWAFPDEDQAVAAGSPSDSSAVANNSGASSETRTVLSAIREEEEDDKESDKEAGACVGDSVQSVLTERSVSRNASEQVNLDRTEVVIKSCAEQMTVAQVTAASVLTLMHWTREYWGIPELSKECPHHWSNCDLVAWCEAFAFDACGVAFVVEQEHEQEFQQEQGESCAVALERSAAQRLEKACGGLVAEAFCLTHVLAMIAGYLEAPLDVKPNFSSWENGSYTVAHCRARARSHADAMLQLGFLCTGTVTAMKLISEPVAACVKENHYLRWVISASCAELMHFARERLSDAGVRVAGSLVGEVVVERLHDQEHIAQQEQEQEQEQVQVQVQVQVQEREQDKEHEEADEEKHEEEQTQKEEQGHGYTSLLSGNNKRTAK